VRSVRHRYITHRLSLPNLHDTGKSMLFHQLEKKNEF